MVADAVEVDFKWQILHKYSTNQSANPRSLEEESLSKVSSCSGSDSRGWVSKAWKVVCDGSPDSPLAAASQLW